ncbi:translation initiation factor IF-2 [Verrucomicrobiales bacterium]|nr:translation initiation factor IF-2 [Verrucomicrobiales bacterium]
MAAKKRTKREDQEQPASKEAKPEAAAPEEKEEVLDLIDPPKKKRVRKKAAKKKTTTAAAKKAGAKEEECEEEKESLADRKAAALNLFEEVETKAEAKKKAPAKKKRAAAKKSSSILPPISAIKAEKEKAMSPVKAKEPEPAPADDTDIDDVEGEEGEEGDEKIINIKPPIIVKELADKMGLKPFKLIAELMKLEVFVSANKSIEPDVAAKVCEVYGFSFEKEKREKGGGVHKVEEVVEEPEAPKEEEQPEEELKLRAPIITFMGHVDHGKTSLLDRIRDARVTSGEAGGITQHIGAYSVKVGEGHITFLDTPGHAAFTQMRARGAMVTDIVVLVVAADDGFMPQTIEAMNHAKAAGVTIMVAVNKCDLPAADPNKVRVQMQENDLAPEDWGGDTIALDVSAATGEGIDKLLEMMALQAEVLELRSNPEVPARATIIESSMQPGKGPTASVVVQMGTIKVGTPFICGPYYGKVKSLLNDQSEAIKEAGPALPVELLGFSGLPNVGDELVEMESERAAKKLSDERQHEMRQEKLITRKKSTLETLLTNLAEGEKKVFKAVLKTDVQGSSQAIQGALAEIESDKISLDIIHSAAGAISESDILLASASDAVVLGFNVKVEGKAVKVAKREGVQVKLYSIIYELIDQVKEGMLGMLDPEHRENTLGHAKVLEVFKLSRGIVAGCVVTNGRLQRNARARVIRDDQPVFDGGFATLRRFKEDVKEVRNGLECGVRLGDFVEYQKDDVIECYELERLEQTL